eukprot:GILJ01000412.1.p1 GENE.GILJ01000412.1~~GILJ01000412.1.p1  ORF type:complete len:525 (+),score=64.20 GILJ01000412.1:95-1669(+)
MKRYTAGISNAQFKTTSALKQQTIHPPFAERVTRVYFQDEFRCRERELAQAQSISTIHVCISILGIVGVLLTTLELCLVWDGDKGVVVRVPFADILKIFISIDTILLELALCLYYSKLVVFDRDKQRVRGSSSGLLRLAFGFVVEMLICAVHPIPYVPATDTPCGIFIFFRLYLILRTLRNLTTTAKLRIELYGLQSSRKSTFSIATDTFEFQRPPFLIVSSVVVWMALSFTVWVSEREMQTDLYTFQTSVWFIVATLTTVGYGDMRPGNDIGRLASMIAAVLGLLYASALSYWVFQYMGRTESAAFMFTYKQAQLWDRQNRELAASYVQQMWRLARVRRTRRQLQARHSEASIESVKDVAWKMTYLSAKTEHLKLQIKESRRLQVAMQLPQKLDDGDPAMERLLRLERHFTVLERHLAHVMRLSHQSVTLASSRSASPLNKFGGEAAWPAEDSLHALAALLKGLGAREDPSTSTGGRSMIQSSPRQSGYDACQQQQQGGGVLAATTTRPLSADQQPNNEDLLP